MSRSRERGIREHFADDPERADAEVFGRRTDERRRGFLKRSGLAFMSMLLGSAIPCWRNFPAGLIPAALAESDEAFVIRGKTGLRILNDRPLNAETPVHMLDDDVTPTELHFIRNNGIPPMRVDPEAWRLRVDGEVESELELSIRDLRREFKVVTLRLQLECGGNGRAAFNPPARGNQWSLGAIGNAEWTGVRYADVLRAAGLKPAAIYTGHCGADAHLSGQADKLPISRGIPLAKALDPHTLIAFEMNGQPMHPMNGAPLRVVAPGWPGSCSQKWLTRIWVRDRVHDGAKMTGTSYRVPKYPVAPGQAVPEEDFRIIESMPVKSIISSPRTGHELPAGQRDLRVRGHAWAGDLEVSAVDVSIDFGRSWSRARLHAPPNKFSWQSWIADLNFPVAGYYEVWARATDELGQAQPFRIAWNPKGYLNNSMHRIAVRVA
jgi:DMSO/TMAO reductase YedYZ molybdopterin-dependent catalytic subunit